MNQRNMAPRARDAGFTLIELLVVVLVIGVLSGIVVLAVSNSTADAKKKACLSNASTVLTALDSYKNSSSGGNGTYPTVAAAAANVSINGNTVNAKAYTAGELAALVPDFIKSLPYTGDTAVTAYLSTETTPRAFVKVTGSACDTTGGAGVGG